MIVQLLCEAAEYEYERGGPSRESNICTTVDDVVGPSVESKTK